MEFIRSTISGAGNLLGLNSTEPTAEAGLNTAAPDSGAVSATQLETRKELHDELLQKGNQTLQSTKPNTSAKVELHRELLESDKSELLHPVDKSAEAGLQKEQYQPIHLESHPELAYEAARDDELNQESLKSRPELQQKPPLFTPMYQSSASYQEEDRLRSEPDRIETIEREQVVRERIHPIVREEIQPVVYREREQLDVKQVTQILHETQIQPTRVEERQLPAQYRENIVQDRAPFEENIVLPSRQMDAVSHSRVMHQPIVNETIKKTILEEIQPVVERDVYQPQVLQTQAPIFEKIVEAPVVTRQTINTQELGNYTVGYEGVIDQANLSYSSFPQSDYSSSSYSQPLYSQSSWTSDHMSRPAEGGLLASRGYGHLPSRQADVLPTGQVLPGVASTRPAYSYLPHGTGDKRPDFIGTSSQYALAANGGTPAKIEFVNPLLPLGNNFFPNNAPQTLQRQ